MEKIFYAEKTAFPSSEEFIGKLLAVHYGIEHAAIAKNKNGKPFLKGVPLFFSVSHTKELYFAALSEENIGIDAESLSRGFDYLPVLNRFSQEERKAVDDKKDFLTLWTAKESIVKWLGGTLARDLKKIAYIDGKAFYLGTELPVCISHFEKEKHIVALCRGRTGETLFIRFSR